MPDKTNNDENGKRPKVVPLGTQSTDNRERDKAAQGLGIIFNLVAILGALEWPSHWWLVLWIFSVAGILK